METQFTVTQVAKHLGISTPTVRRLIAEHEITAVRAGLRKWMIPQSSLDEYRAGRLSQAKKKPPASAKPVPVRKRKSGD